MVEAVKELIRKGNVRRIVIEHQGRTVAEFPLTAGLVGVVLAPVVAAIGALVALLKDCTIHVERTGAPEVESVPFGDSNAPARSNAPLK
jgi:Flp pilus assembly pilin Flp